jgi:hypothetical protein
MPDGKSQKDLPGQNAKLFQAKIYTNTTDPPQTPSS